MRERGKRKISLRDRDLTTTKETGFAKMLTRAALLGKRAVFGIEISEIRDMTRDCRELGNPGSGSPPPRPLFNYDLDPLGHLINVTKFCKYSIQNLAVFDCSSLMT